MSCGGLMGFTVGAVFDMNEVVGENATACKAYQHIAQHLVEMRGASMNAVKQLFHRPAAA